MNPSMGTSLEGRAIFAMIRAAVSALLALMAGIATMDLSADTPQIVNCDGYPCVNFSFGANVSTNGELFGSLFFNRPQLGEGLDPIGGGRFEFEVGAESLTARQCAERQVSRAWPFAAVTLADPRLQGIQIHARALVPNALDDSFIGSLPVALAEFTLTNSSRALRNCQISFIATNLLRHPVRVLNTDSARGLASEKNFAAWLAPLAVTNSDNATVARVTLAPQAAATFRFVTGHWEDNWPCSARLSDMEKLVSYIARNWNTLVAATERFERRLPRTGDPHLDDSLRWYLTAGTAMTRVLKDGTALTMGYHELNQRDSFWTTWMHLVLWPALERRMIEESVWAQRPNGKVPTTILPVIEREDDIDINCYFILRALRYARFYGDEELGRKCLPALILAADWLAARDEENAGLPQAKSYWYDWKDVSGVQERKYSPYASMLYVAAMQRLGAFCEQAGEPIQAAKFKRLAKRGVELLNRSIPQGGLWNGLYYQQVWKDPNRLDARVLQDQVVGILFNVVDDNKAKTILAALQANASPWGVRETYPYQPDSFGYKGGDYHNGGIWPWVNHAHAWALLKRGERMEAYAILNRMARADLEMAGDYIPHEYLNGETGQQAGVPMQGWNAAMFGTLYFGLSEGSKSP